MDQPKVVVFFQFPEDKPWDTVYVEAYRVDYDVKGMRGLIGPVRVEEGETFRVAVARRHWPTWLKPHDDDDEALEATDVAEVATLDEAEKLAAMMRTMTTDPVTRNLICMLAESYANHITPDE